MKLKFDSFVIVAIILWFIGSGILLFSETEYYIRVAMWLFVCSVILSFVSMMCTFKEAYDIIRKRIEK